jgi:hypothetical protein
MARGYGALAGKCEAPRSGEAGRAVKDALERLNALGSDNGRFFADQIARAGQVFNDPTAAS